MNTFVWNQPGEWLKSTKEIVTDLWGSDFIYTLRRNKIKPNVFDPKFFLNAIVHKNNTKSFLTNFSNSIANHWSNITVYHACRVNHIDDYYKKGITPPTIESLDKLVHQTLSPFVETDMMSELFKILKLYYDKTDEKVFVAMDKHHLLLHCNHHLAYGSEYLLSAIMLLPKFGINVEPILVSLEKSIETIPTLFECELPINNLSEEDINELSIILLGETCNRLLDENYLPLSRRTGFAVNGKIQPKWISSHFHPFTSADVKTLPAIWIDTFPRYNF